MKIVYITVLALTAAASADISLSPIKDHGHDYSNSYTVETNYRIDSMELDGTPVFTHHHDSITLSVWWETDTSILDTYTWDYDDGIKLSTWWSDSMQGIEVNNVQVDWHLHKHSYGPNVRLPTPPVVPAPGVFALFGIAALGARRQRTR